MSRRGLLFVIACALASSCQGGEDATEIVLEVTSEVLPPNIDQVAFRVIGPSGTEKASRSYPIARVDEFPVRLGLLHESGPLGPYDVRVAALLANEEVTSEARALSFEPGRRKLESFRLPARGGQGGMGAGGMGGALPMGGAGGSPDAGSGGAGGMGGMAPDAGSGGASPSPDAGPDAFVCPSGCECEQENCGNRAQGCTCNAGCPCVLGCSAVANCKTDCAAAATCDIDASRSSRATVDCAARSTCRIIGRSSSAVNVTCRGADCTLDCENAASCGLDCRNGSTCLLRCAGAATCQLRDCVGARSCPGNIQVCGRACP